MICGDVQGFVVFFVTSVFVRVCVLGLTSYSESVMSLFLPGRECKGVREVSESITCWTIIPVGVRVWPSI